MYKKTRREIPTACFLRYGGAVLFPVLLLVALILVLLVALVLLLFLILILIVLAFFHGKFLLSPLRARPYCDRRPAKVYNYF